MRSFKKTILTVLAMMPVASISTVAYCQLNEMAGEEQNDLLQGDISTSHKLLMAPGTTAISVDDSKSYLSQQTGITDPQALDEVFNQHLKLLVAKGLVEKNESNITSHIPSAW